MNPMSRKPQQLTVQPRRKPKPQPKYSFKKNPDDFPCPICGDKDFKWGEHDVIGYDRNPVMRSTIQYKTRICLSCGNVQTFL